MDITEIFLDALLKNGVNVDAVAASVINGHAVINVTADIPVKSLTLTCKSSRQTMAEILHLEEALKIGDTEGYVDHEDYVPNTDTPELVVAADKDL